jgi:TonB family protein
MVAVAFSAQGQIVSTENAGVGIAKLSEPAYPSIALAAQVSGKVELEIAVRRDGTIQSAAVVSGPAMLRKSALDSAQQISFQCSGCGEGLTRFHMTYSFELAGAYHSSCTSSDSATVAPVPEKSYPQITHGIQTVTIIDQPIGACDCAFRVPVRSVKCLFLWKCGSR